MMRIIIKIAMIVYSILHHQFYRILMKIDDFIFVVPHYTNPLAISHVVHLASNTGWSAVAIDARHIN